MGDSALERRAVAAIKRRRASLPGIGQQDRSSEGRGRTALVTGASSGIGRTMAELLAAKGYDIIVVARRAQRLKELQADLEARFGVTVHPLPCDLNTTSAASDIDTELRTRNLRVDFLVNNAGYDMLGRFLDHSWEEHEKFVRLMAVGVAELTHRLLPHMIEQRWGRIINVTSVGGMFPGAPSMALYTASKSFVHKLSEAIAGEYAPDGVHCTVSAPGATETELFEVVGVEDYWQNNLLPQISMMRCETVVRQAYSACMAGQKVVVHGAPNKVWAATLLHTPKAVRYRLVGFLAKMQPPPAAPTPVMEEATPRP
jgi:short-subunit dehydrogenase